MVDTTVTLTDTDTTEARGLPHLKPMLMPKLPLMPGTDTTVLDTVDTMDTVWDITVTDTVWDTVDTTDTDIPVLTDTTTTTARGLLMLNLKPNLKPKLMPPLMLGTDTMAVLTDITGMAEDTMVDTTDTVMDTDTDTTVKKLL